jgi:hypothetical protein
MSLRDWESNGWLTAEPTGRSEIGNLLAIVDRDMSDARGSISVDWRFGIAYNAALKLCSVLLRAEGYRPAHGLHHYRTIMALPLILGEEWSDQATYLDTCRALRNRIEYDYVGGATEDNVNELLEFLEEFRVMISEWLERKHPELL